MWIVIWGKIGSWFVIRIPLYHPVSGVSSFCGDLSYINSILLCKYLIKYASTEIVQQPKSTVRILFQMNSFVLDAVNQLAVSPEKMKWYKCNGLKEESGGKILKCASLVKFLSDLSDFDIIMTCGQSLFILCINLFICLQFTDRQLIPVDPWSHWITFQLEFFI